MAPRRRRTTGPRLSPSSWTDAALEAIAEGGIAGVVVETLAERIGATKGSFYWHFASRDDLIAATLERWEQVRTTAIVAELEAIDDPSERLQALAQVETSGSIAVDVEVALLVSADHPVVGPMLHRVYEQRVAFVTKLYSELGFTRTEAAARALLTYSAFLGRLAIRRVAPDLLPSGRALRAHLLRTINILAANDAP